MARPVEFDRADALEAAMRLFWSQGYGATSLSQLLDAASIQRSSFYAAFGDKRSLFEEVLTLFADRTRAILRDLRERGDPLAAIQGFFYATLLEVPRARAGRGCMMINSVIELADVDPGLARRAERELAEVESLFEACFRDAQQTGIYPTEISARDLAAHVMVLNQGLRVASRKAATRRELKRDIDTALSLLGLPAPNDRARGLDASRHSIHETKRANPSERAQE